MNHWILFENDKGGNAWTPSAEDKEALLSSAWFWPEADAVLANVKSAESIACAETLSLDEALEQTKTLVKIAREKNASAIVFADRVLVSAPMFLEEGADAEPTDPPLYLWLKFVGIEREGETELGMRTEGMKQFGRMEVEVDRSNKDGEYILECVYDAALFLLTDNQTLETGDVLELSRDKVRVRIEPSLSNNGEKALRIRV